MTQKKQPLRMCIVCRAMKPKPNLVRVAKHANGTITVDQTQKSSGRGAWVCAEEACLSKLKKSKSLNRAFRKEIAEDIYVKTIEVANNASKQQN